MDFFISVVTIAIQLVFFGCLLFLWIKTKSTGFLLICIGIAMQGISEWVYPGVYTEIMSRTESGVGLFSFINVDVINGIHQMFLWTIGLLCGAGVVSIYYEWKKDKFTV